VDGCSDRAEDAAAAAFRTARIVAARHRPGPRLHRVGGRDSIRTGPSTILALGDTARMSRHSWIVIALTLSTVAGCSSAPKPPPDNTAAVCAEYLTTMEQFYSESPEGRALTDAVTRRHYKGTIDEADYQHAVTTFNRAFGVRLKPLADKATNPELKDALTELSDAYSAGRSGIAAVNAIAAICPDPSPSPSHG
jgi:hypothetical protein